MIPAAIAAVLVFFGISDSCSSCFVDDEGVGDPDALIMWGADAGAAGVLLDIGIDVSSTDDVDSPDGDMTGNGDGVDEVTNPGQLTIDALRGDRTYSM